MKRKNPYKWRNKDGSYTNLYLFLFSLAIIGILLLPRIVFNLLGSLLTAPLLILSIIIIISTFVAIANPFGRNKD